MAGLNSTFDIILNSLFKANAALPPALAGASMLNHSDPKVNKAL